MFFSLHQHQIALPLAEITKSHQSTPREGPPTVAPERVNNGKKSPGREKNIAKRVMDPIFLLEQISVGFSAGKEIVLPKC